MTDISAANTQFYTSQRTADANYITSDHAGRLLSLNNLHTAANLPFTEFAAGQATAEQTAWANVQTAFNTAITNINGETTTYDNSVATHITGLATTSSGAQNTYIGTVAPAIQTRDVAHAGAWKSYDELSASAEEIYQGQIAQAQRDNAVAIAQAERNLLVNGDQIAYDNAIALANSQLADAEQTAARAYGVAEVGAQGNRDIALDSANATLDTTEGNAWTANVDTVTAAIRDAQIADAAAYRDMYLSVLAELDGFDLTLANSRLTELTNLDTTNESPWSGLAVGKVTAYRDQLVDLQPANTNYRQTTADAHAAFTTSHAGAGYDLINAQTQASVNLTNDQNAAVTTKLSTEHTQFQEGINLGIAPVETNEWDGTSLASTDDLTNVTNAETTFAGAAPEIQFLPYKPGEQDASAVNLPYKPTPGGVTALLDPTNVLGEATDKEAGVNGTVGDMSNDEFLETAVADASGRVVVSRSELNAKLAQMNQRIKTAEFWLGISLRNYYRAAAALPGSPDWQPLLSRKINCLGKEIMTRP